MDMTFREAFAVLYSRTEQPPPRHRLLVAIRLIASLRGPSHDFWIECRNRWLEARHG